MIKRVLALALDAFFVHFINSNLVAAVLSESVLVVNSNNSMLLGFLCYLLFFDFVNSGQTLGKLIIGVEKLPINDVYQRMTRTLLKIFSIYLSVITLVVYFI